MNKTFTRLAQANLDHYNNHPVAHATITVAYVATMMIVVPKVVRRILKPNVPAIAPGTFTK